MANISNAVEIAVMEFQKAKLRRKQLSPASRNTSNTSSSLTVMCTYCGTHRAHSISNCSNCGANKHQ